MMSRRSSAFIHVTRTTTSLVLALGASQAGAAGFEIPQKGIKEMGVGHGGSAALLEDATAVANNPAGLLRLEGTNVSGGITAIRSRFDYDVEVHREDGGTVPGRNEGSITGLSTIPHAYYSRRISEDAAVGFGIYAPFGSSTEYPDDWAGRYHATETQMSAVNFNPVFAWRTTSTISLGAGAVVQHLDAEFQNKIDLGYLVAEEIMRQSEDQPLWNPDEEEVNGDLAHKFDVDNGMNVDSWAYGFNFGLLWEPWNHTRVGLNYHSQVRHVGEGEARRPQTRDPAFQQRLADVINLHTPMGAGGEEGAAKAVGPLGAAGGDIQLIAEMPEIATLSFYHDLTDRLAILGGATYTRWSRMDEFRSSYTDDSDRGGEDYTGSGDDVRRRDLVQPLEWEDTMRYGLGVIYRPSAKWTLRAGASYDESPVPSAERRTPRGPDSDRIIAAIGAGWQWSDKLDFDLAYAYTHFQPSRINNRENPSGTHHRIEGDYEGHLHSAALQVNYAF